MKKIYYILTGIIAVLATILFGILTTQTAVWDAGSMLIIHLLLIAMSAGCLVLSVIGLKNDSPIRPVISEKAGGLITGFGAIVFVVVLDSDGLMLQALPIAIPAFALGILCFTKGRKKLIAVQTGKKWNAYKEALFAKIPSLKDTLREGASTAEIRKAEAELGLRFPEPLKGLYLTNDGDNGKAVCGAILGLHFLSLKEMCRDWRSMKELLESESKDLNKNSNSTFSPEGCIKHTASPETAAYYEIAGLLGLSAGHRGMIDTPARYYTDHKDTFEERSVHAEETNAIRRIGMLDEIIAQNRICEFDFKEEKADCLAGLQRILPATLTIDASRLDEDADISAWAEQINASWQDTGYVLIGFDIDGDSYVTYVCTKEVFSKLSKAAKMVWHRVALLQDL